MTTTGGSFHGDAKAETTHLPEGNDSDGSYCFCDEQDQSWHSAYQLHTAGSSGNQLLVPSASASDHNGSRAPEPSRNSCISDGSAEFGFVRGVPETKISIPKVDKDCRICHLGLASASPGSGFPIELGCSCKDDLAVAHKQCAEAWFKIRGNRTCEVCGSVARNVVGTSADINEQPSETTNSQAALATETQSFWRGHRFLSFLLACLVFAFVVSWLFHFNVPG